MTWSCNSKPVIGPVLCFLWASELILWKKQKSYFFLRYNILGFLFPWCWERANARPEVFSLLKWWGTGSSPILTLFLYKSTHWNSATDLISIYSRYPVNTIKCSLWFKNNNVCDVSTMAKPVPLIVFSLPVNWHFIFFLISPHQRALENSNRGIGKAYKTWKISEKPTRFNLREEPMLCKFTLLFTQEMQAQAQHGEPGSFLLLTVKSVRTTLIFRYKLKGAKENTGVS